MTRRSARSGENAHRSCAQLPPWDLAAITDDTELTDLFKYVTQADVWIGGNDLATEGEFAWTTGEPWFAGGWKVGEPSGGLTDNCVLREHLSGSFADAVCATKQAYLCERPGLLE